MSQYFFSYFINVTANPSPKGRTENINKDLENPTTPKFCRNCGEKLSIGSKFCKKCGNKI
jgi:ribosomal protein L40E